MEEEATPKVTPPIYILRLYNGNIGSKINTSRVWHKLKLNLILPNLPSECNFIITCLHQRNSKNSDSGLRSKKFKRYNIQRSLELPSQNVFGIWKPTQTFQLQISNNFLNLCPEEGDLVVFNPDLPIYETEDYEITEPQQNDDVPICVVLDADLNYGVPDPLQKLIFLLRLLKE